MRKTVIGLLATALVFAVAACWALRKEPAARSLLVIPAPAKDRESLPEPELTSGGRGFQVGQSDPAVEKPGTMDAVGPSKITDERRDQVRQLIRQIRPEQTKTAIEVWVDEFGHMGDDDISFLITQSAMLSNFGDVGASSNELTSGVLAEQSGLIPSATPADTVRTDSRFDTARMNLKNTMTVGYRDHLNFNVLSAGENANPQQISLRRLTSGEAFETGDPLHLALRTPGLVFFQLADGRLTRNGMFSRMNDGRLGLQARDGFVALQNSPVLPTDQWCVIQSDGRVFDEDVRSQIGSIQVVKVECADQLTTEDGVYFRTREPVEVAEQFELLVGALELSNVDVDRNRHVLNALQHHR